MAECGWLRVAAGNPQPAKDGADAEMQVIPVPLTFVSELGAMRITMPEDLRPPENRKAVLNTLRVPIPTILDTLHGFPAALPLVATLAQCHPCL